MAWKDLTIAQRSQLMNTMRHNGITSLSEMRRLYDLSSQPSIVEDTFNSKPIAPVYAEGGHKPEDYKKVVEDRFPIAQTYKYNVYPDEAVSGGYGDIETFAGDWAKDIIHYNNGFTLDNRYPGETSIVFNPNKVTDEDIALDALHIAREQDPIYQSLLAKYEEEALKTRYEDFRRDGPEEDFHNGVDGVLRGSMYRGDRVKAGYAPAEEYEWLYNEYPKLGEAYKDLRQYLESGYILPATVTANKMADGGSIHIKKENRGKFTALKKRTGHSASWFKAHGTPAQKKMAIFALNAKKWKHSHGGIKF